jgi:hypothetical protein
MANFYTTNYQKAYVDVPSDKFERGELAGKKRIIFGTIVVPTTLAVSDKIYVGKLPAGARITNAKIYINKDLGASGIVSLGLGVHGTEVADADALVTACDGGEGPALNAAAAGQAGLYKKLSYETEVYATCTEAVDGAVSDASAFFEVEYVID